MLKKETKQYGKLYLIPNLLGSSNVNLIPEFTSKIIQETKIFIAEKAKSTRAYLNLFNVDVHKVKIIELDKHKDSPDFTTIFEPIFQGDNMGIISESGCPAVADPGSVLINYAHNFNIKVKPLIGPSSILLALMASGLNGQSFKFNGYLPKHPNSRKNEINRLENESKKYNLTQIFIETPYRNEEMLEDLIKLCSNKTHISLSIDLTLETEEIITDLRENWKIRKKPKLKDRQVVFLLQA